VTRRLAGQSMLALSSLRRTDSRSGPPPKQDDGSTALDVLSRNDALLAEAIDRGLHHRR
jgi:hypothetical protein